MEKFSREGQESGWLSKWSLCLGLALSFAGLLGCQSPPPALQGVEGQRVDWEGGLAGVWVDKNGNGNVTSVWTVTKEGDKRGAYTAVIIEPEAFGVNGGELAQESEEDILQRLETIDTGPSAWPHFFIVMFEVKKVGDATIVEITGVAAKEQQLLNAGLLRPVIQFVRVRALGNPVHTLRGEHLSPKWVNDFLVGSSADNRRLIQHAMAQQDDIWIDTGTIYRISDVVPE